MADRPPLDVAMEALVRHIELGQLIVCPTCEGQSSLDRPCPVCGVRKGECGPANLNNPALDRSADSLGIHKARHCPTCEGGVWVTPAEAAPALLVEDDP